MSNISNMSKKGTVDYSNGKIYIIKNTENDKVYVGSTSGTLNKRLSKHVWSRNSKTNMPLYAAMRDIGKDCFYIELIEDYACENITQLRAREGYWIRYYQSWLAEHGYNLLVEGRTVQEYRIECKDRISQRNKIYREANKDKTQEGWKKWYAENKEHVLERCSRRVVCECGCELTHGALNAHKKTKKHIQAMALK